MPHNPQAPCLLDVDSNDLLHIVPHALNNGYSLQDCLRILQTDANILLCSLTASSDIHLTDPLATKNHTLTFEFSAPSLHNKHTSYSTNRQHNPHPSWGPPIFHLLATPEILHFLHSPPFQQIAITPTTPLNLPLQYYSTIPFPPPGTPPNTPHPELALTGPLPFEHALSPSAMTEFLRQANPDLPLELPSFQWLLSQLHFSVSLFALRSGNRIALHMSPLLNPTIRLTSTDPSPVELCQKIAPLLLKSHIALFHTTYAPHCLLGYQPEINYNDPTPWVQLPPTHAPSCLHTILETLTSHESLFFYSPLNPPPPLFTTPPHSHTTPFSTIFPLSLSYPPRNELQHHINSKVFHLHPSFQLSC